MAENFAEKLRKLRLKKQISQQRLAEMLFVDRSSVASWETGRRLPDAAMLARIAAYLDADAGELLHFAAMDQQSPNVILVDDEKIILSGTLSVLREALPDAEITGFTSPAEAVAFARERRVDLAFLDIEIGAVSGFAVCRELLESNPNTNVIFLTAYMDYSYHAWETGACGFLLKPLLPQSVDRALTLLRHPIPRGPTAGDAAN